MSIPSTAAISSTFSRPSSDSIDGNMMMFSLAHGAYSVAWRAPWPLFPVVGPVAGAVALVPGVRPLAGDAPVADRRVLRQADDGARLLGVFHLGHLDAHDALIQDAGDQMRERFVEPNDGRDVRGLEPARQLCDRCDVERPVFVVDRAVIEAGRFDDPGNAA